jgi:hypothetical protein
MLIPVLGPGVAATQSDEGDAGLAVVLWIMTAAQAVGAGLLIAGHVRVARHRRDERGLARRGPSLALLPAGPGGRPGLSMGGVF